MAYCQNEDKIPLSKRFNIWFLLTKTKFFHMIDDTLKMHTLKDDHLQFHGFAQVSPVCSSCPTFNHMAILPMNSANLPLVLLCLLGSQLYSNLTSLTQFSPLDWLWSSETQISHRGFCIWNPPPHVRIFSIAGPLSNSSNSSILS